MAQNWRVRPGTTVRYRDTTGRIHHAIVVAVDDPDTVDLRLGHETPITGVARVAERDAAEGPGWYRSSELDGGPLARFTVTDKDGLVVAFDASTSEGDALTFAWDFGDDGDGSSVDETTATPQHTYLASGVYYVTLTVTDANLRSSGTSHRVVI